MTLFNTKFLASLISFISISSAQSSSSPSLASTGFTNYPVLTLTPRSGLVFDYHVEIGSPPQTLGLRLDICNGELWLPDSNGYTVCATTYSDISTTTTKSSTASSTSSTKKTNTTTSSSITSMASSSQKNISSTTSATGYCASDGIYTMSDSLSGDYYNIESGENVNRSDASPVDQTFLDYVYIEGVYATDNFTINLTSAEDYVELEDVIFRAVNSSDVSLGALAMGNTVDGLPTFLERLVDDGLINANGYSLSLGDAYGEVLLGGVSKDRFHGALVEFDFIPISDSAGSIFYSGESLSHPVVPISGFGVTSNSTGKSFQFEDYYFDEITTGKYPRPAILDSRNYYNYIPYSTLIDIAVELNAYYAASLNRWLVTCDVGNTGTLDVLMGNLTVHIPISDLLFEAYDQDTKARLYFASGEYACFVGLLPDYYYGFSILGTPFLKNIYLAVDNDGKKLAMGTPVNLTQTALPKLEDEDIRPISSGYIPYAVPNNLTSYSDLTLTVTSGSIALSSDVSPQTAVISNGEVFVGDSLTATVSISANEISLSPSESDGSASASGSFTSTKKGDASSRLVDSTKGFNLINGGLNSFTILIYSSIIVFALVNLL